ncbi:helix-turn-helix domain-containing protein [Lysinibacillus sp. UGB7]|uniref:helix-turn-helix domain-containing protein n=1 Tax=Lysinibacillus sp. UGB7 TaxID=3411039 RepID=UPI003B7BC5AE
MNITKNKDGKVLNMMGAIGSGKTSMFIKALDLEFFSESSNSTTVVKNFEMLTDAIQAGSYDDKTYLNDLIKVVTLINDAEKNPDSVAEKEVEAMKVFVEKAKFPENIVLVLNKKIKVFSNRLMRSSDVNLGEIVSSVRKEANMTLKMIEQETGITSSYLSRLEANNSKSVPSITIVKLLSEALNHDFFQYFKPEIEEKEAGEKISINEVLRANDFYIVKNNENYSHSEKSMLADILSEIVNNDFEENQMFEVAKLMEKIKRFKTATK